MCRQPMDPRSRVTRLVVTTLLVLGAWIHAGADGAIQVSKSGGRQPQVAVSPDGPVYVVWASGDAIECAIAPKSGDAFAEPVKVGEIGGLMAGMRRGPRVAAGDKAVVVTGVGKSGGNLQAWRSEDGGRTWAGPASVNGEASAAREGMTDLAASPKGSFHAAWLDLRQGKAKIWAAVSSDHGASWTETKVYESPSGAVCECCNPSIAADAQGKVYLMFRNSIDGYRDMYMAASPDGGKTWGRAAKLGGAGWKIDACPMQGGAVTAATGRPLAVWVRERGVYLTGPSGGETELGKGCAPWVAGGPDGMYAVWQQTKDGGNLFVVRPKGGVTTLDRGSYAAVGGDPKAGVVAAWEANGQIMTAVLAKPKK